MNKLEKVGESVKQLEKVGCPRDCTRPRSGREQGGGSWVRRTFYFLLLVATFFYQKSPKFTSAYRFVLFPGVPWAPWGPFSESWRRLETVEEGRGSLETGGEGWRRLEKV